MEFPSRYRKMTVDNIYTLVESFTKGHRFGILGESRVNGVLFNLALDEMLE
jgi:K+-transporting ATPase c subunit